MKISDIRSLFLTHNFELNEITHTNGHVLVIAEPVNPSGTIFRSPLMSTRKAAYNELLNIFFLSLKVK